MTKNELLERSKSFTLRISKLASALPDSFFGRTVGSEILIAGYSITAELIKAKKLRNRSEFLLNLSLVEQALENCLLWIDILVETEQVGRHQINFLYQEGENIIKIINDIKKQSFTNNENLIHKVISF